MNCDAPGLELGFMSQLLIAEPSVSSAQSLEITWLKFDRFDAPIGLPPLQTMKAPHLRTRHNPEQRYGLARVPS
jgi:hypothetical protein